MWFRELFGEDTVGCMDGCSKECTEGCAESCMDVVH